MVQVYFFNGLGGVLISNCFGVEIFSCSFYNFRRNGNRANGFQLVHPSVQGFTGFLVIFGSVISNQVPQQSFEVRGNQDVHSWGVGRLDFSWLSQVSGLFVATSSHESVQDIILVSSDDQFVNWQTHFLSVVASKNVTKVSRRNNESDVVGLVQLEEGVEVVSHSSQDSCPVDRVHSTNVVLFVELSVTKDLLDNVLTIVKSTFHGKDKDVNVLFASQTVNGSRTGVTRSSTHNSNRLSVGAFFASIASGQEVFEKITNKSQGHILESISWAMEQFQQVEVLGFVKGFHWSDVFGSEGGVRPVDQLLQVSVGDLRSLNVEPHDVEGQSSEAEVLPFGQEVGRGVHTGYSDKVFQSVIDRGYNGIDAVKQPANWNLDNQKFFTESDAKLNDIVSEFNADIISTVGYGSGVFEQTGYEEKPKNLQVDLIHIVDNTAQFHQSNLRNFSHHYSGLKYGGIFLIELFQNMGAGLYFNPFVRIKNTLTKYGIISINRAEKDLVEWSNLYVAGRLQKPIKFISDNNNLLGQRLQLLNHYNLKSAFSLSLLLNAGKKVNETTIYETITSLSYLGDPRMLVGGENPHKVKNIVSKQFSNFKKLYEPYRAYFVEKKILIPYKNTSVAEEQRTNPNICTVPEINRAEYKVNLTDSDKISLIENLPLNFRSQIFELYGSEHLSTKKQEDLQLIVRDEDLNRKLVETIIKTVRIPSLLQSVKGLFTSGIVKSSKYMWEKRMKYNKSQT